MADITGHPQGRCKQKLEAKHALGLNFGGAITPTRRACGNHDVEL